MKRTALVVITIALVTALHAATAHAQLARTFVSGQGSDSNPCTLPFPCRTLQVAHNNTNAGGEIDVLTPAGYGALTINRAISISNDGVGTASILVPAGGIGITIDAGADDAISLRGLTIEGAGAGQYGIQFSTGSSLTIENSIIRHVTLHGIFFYSFGACSLFISNTLVADNGGSGIRFEPNGSDVVTAVFNRIEATNNSASGISVKGSGSTGTVSATVSESVAARNGGTGFAVLGGSAAPTTLSVNRSVAANNGTGISANGVNATLRATQSMVTGNTTGWAALSSGVIQSYGDNSIDGNGANTGVLIPIGKQ